MSAFGWRCNACERELSAKKRSAKTGEPMTLKRCGGCGMSPAPLTPEAAQYRDTRTMHYPPLLQLGGMPT